MAIDGDALQRIREALKLTEGDDASTGEDPDPDDEPSRPDLSAADLARDARAREEER
jgi:hypothetical protein